MAYETGKVTGVKECIAALEQLEPELHDLLLSQVRGSAQAAAAAVSGALPAGAPLSGMEHDGRTGWNNLGAEAVEDDGEDNRGWPIYRIMLTGGGAAMADIAGAASGGISESGQNMVSYLNMREGRASRWVWPVARQNESKFVAGMQNAVDKASDATTAKLAE